MKTIIISGSDDKYFKFLKNLVYSLYVNNCFKYADLGILDVGLSEDNLKFLKKFSSKIKKPNWDLKFNFKAANWKKILTSRPFLRDYFPGYDNYIWLDSDTFVQENSFINIFNEISKNNSLGICSENSYEYTGVAKGNELKNIFYDFFLAKGWTYKNNKKFLSKKFAKMQLNRPLFNAGVFCMPNKSFIWKEWAKVYQNVLFNSANEYSLNMDQATLNKVIYDNLEKINLLPEEYNWLCKNRLPCFNYKNKKFYNHFYPKKEIKILHLTQLSLEKFYKLRTFEGKIIKMIIKSNN